MTGQNRYEFIFSRLTTKRNPPLIFSINADSQWGCCSQTVPTYP